MTERRHLGLEDQVILPLARRRLSPADLDRIGRAMAARRNIDFPLQSDIVP
jgi:hemerythrin-like domain-containing protein